MLNDRTILITGAASGLGRAWSEGFHAEGAQVFGADINAEGLAELAGLGIQTLEVDVADAEQVQGMVEAAVAATGHIDVLFNNAGLGFGHRLEDAPDGAFERHVAVHLFGCVNGMRAALPHMRRQGYGRIINTLSRNAEVAVPTTSAYAAAKAAMWAATRVTAAEVTDVDILINMLIPGPTNTPIWGRERPNLQPPAATYATARMLATLATGGPTGKVYWNEQEYALFDPGNAIQERTQPTSGQE